MLTFLIHILLFIKLYKIKEYKIYRSSDGY